MAEVTVQNLKDEVHRRLLQLAQREGRSVEDVAREILQNAILQTSQADQGFGTRLAARFAPYRPTQDLPELPRQETKPLSFER